jgi:hypothetical protein
MHINAGKRVHVRMHTEVHTQQPTTHQRFDSSPELLAAETLGVINVQDLLNRIGEWYIPTIQKRRNAS